MAQVTRFKAFESAGNSYDGVSNLDPTLTINGANQTPSFRYKGGSANGTDIVAWTYGNTLPISSTGTAPTYNTGSPLLGSNDDSVTFNAGKYYKYGSSGLGVIGTNDFVLELVFRFKLDAGLNLSLGGARDSNSPSGGWFLWVPANTKKLRLDLKENGTTQVQIDTDTELEDNAWYHVMFFVNRDENSTYGARVYVNGVLSGSGTNPYSLNGIAIDGNSTTTRFTLGGLQNDTWVCKEAIAYIAGWIRSSWHAAGSTGANEWATIAKNRFHSMIGVKATQAAGTAYPITASRSTVAWIDKMESGKRKLYKVGRDWIRCCSRPNDPASDAVVKGVVLEAGDANIVSASSDMNNGWSKTQLTVSTGHTSPEKLPNAFGLIASNVNGSHYIKSAGYATNHIDSRNMTNVYSRYTFSIFAKAGSKNFIRLEQNSSGSVDSYVYFDLVNGDCKSSNDVDAGAEYVKGYIEDWGDGWFRCSVTFKEPTTWDPANGGVTIYLAEADDDIGFAGDNSTVTTYVFGPQVEKTPWPSTYYDSGVIGGDNNHGPLRGVDTLIYKADDGNLDAYNGTPEDGEISIDVLMPYQLNGSLSDCSNYGTDQERWDCRAYRPILWIGDDSFNNYLRLRYEGLDEFGTEIGWDAQMKVSGAPASGIADNDIGRYGSDVEGKHTLKIVWPRMDPPWTQFNTFHLTWDGTAPLNAPDSGVWPLTNPVTKIAVGCDFTTSGLEPFGEMLGELIIKSTDAVNNISIANLAISSITNTGFTATIDYSGDDNNSSTVTLYYCNNTDNPGCNPEAGSSLTMTRNSPSSGYYRGIVTGISSSEGDTFNVRVKATDLDGVTGSPLNTTTTLAVYTTTIVSGVVYDILTNGFSVKNNYSGDGNANGSAMLWWCNRTDNPGCNPTDWFGYAMTKDSPANGFYGKVMSGLTGTNNPSDQIAAKIVATDSDGVSGSPIDLGTFYLTSVNNITISSLYSDNVTDTSFDTHITFYGDQNDNAVATLWYCNDTDNPGCDPLSGTSILMTRTDTDVINGTFDVSVTGLANPYDPLDELNLKVVVSDTDGVTGSPLTGSVILGGDSTTLINGTVSGITSTGWTTSIQYIGDQNSNNSVTLFYCNDTQVPGCDPLLGDSVLMTRDSPFNGLFSVTINGLPGTDPGEDYSLVAVATDPDGTISSPYYFDDPVTLLIGTNAYLIRPDITTFTANDSPLLNEIDLQGMLYGQNKIAEFQVGNFYTNYTIDITLLAQGNNLSLVSGVQFSINKVEWDDTVSVAGIKPNGLSGIVYMKFQPTSDVYIGEGTFKIKIQVDDYYV